MLSFLKKYWKYLLSFLFVAAVVVFWALPYMSALAYQEQLQMFLFDSDYLRERLALPGGLADYLGEFLVQFNYVPVAGAIFVALLLGSIQVLTWLLYRQLTSRKETKAFPGYLLSFVPPILLWCYMGDPSVLLSFVIAMVAALAVAWGHGCLHKRSIKLVYELVAIVAVYWLFGPTVFIMVVLMMVQVIKDGVGERRLSLAVGHAAALLVVALAAVLLLTNSLQYPLYRIFGGINYYRYPGVVPVMQTVVMAVTAFVPMLGGVNIKGNAWQKLQQSKGIIGLSYTLLIVASVFGIRKSFDTMTYDLIEYDFLVRVENWDGILRKAEKVQPSTPMSVACVNLALSQKGQLADRLFDFYQNGGEGLFPTFTRDMTSPVSTAEVYYRLGMVNDAERYMFEAQEAIPNYRKSSRMTRRIAECEIINGHYKVAEKLLRRLQKTVFYSDWATQTLALLGNEKAINAHPVYGKLRRYREKKEDFLFSDREMDQMVGKLFVNDMSNKMAFEYLTCYVLLQRDMDKFMQYYPLGRYVNYNHIPRAFQEILIGNWVKTHPDLRSLPYSVDAQTVNNTMGFIQTYMQNPNSPQLNALPYASNAWHYLLIDGKKNTPAPGESKEIY